MKVTVVVGVFGSAQSAGLDPSGERSECEHICWDPKDGELCLNNCDFYVLRAIYSEGPFIGAS